MKLLILTCNIIWWLGQKIFFASFGAYISSNVCLSSCRLLLCSCSLLSVLGMHLNLHSKFQLHDTQMCWKLVFENWLPIIFTLVQFCWVTKSIIQQMENCYLGTMQIYGYYGQTFNSGLPGCWFITAYGLQALCAVSTSCKTIVGHLGDVQSIYLDGWLWRSTKFEFVGSYSAVDNLGSIASPFGLIWYLLTPQLHCGWILSYLKCLVKVTLSSGAKNFQVLRPQASKQYSSNRLMGVHLVACAVTVKFGSHMFGPWMQPIPKIIALFQNFQWFLKLSLTLMLKSQHLSWSYQPLFDG